MRDFLGRFSADTVVPGETYGNLTVISFNHKDKNGQYYVQCRCKCGKEIIVRRTLLTSGKQVSCGCLRRGMPTKKNEVSVNGDIAKIHLFGGRFALIDAEDVEKVSGHYWNMQGRYVGSYTAGPLHRFIMNGASMIDHKNGNTLDNRKCNLRECNQRQNAINRRLRTDNKTGFAGVSERNGKYIAQIKLGNIRKSKTFEYLEDALCQRKSWEKELFGEWAREAKYLAADTGVTGLAVDICLPDHASTVEAGVRSAEVWIVWEE